MNDSDDLLIFPEDELRVLVSLGKLPHGARVTMRTGEKEYTLCRRLRVSPGTGGTVMEVKGFFLVSGPNIEQAEPDELMLWIVSADDLYELLHGMYAETPQ